MRNGKMDEGEVLYTPGDRAKREDFGRHSKVNMPGRTDGARGFPAARSSDKRDSLGRRNVGRDYIWHLSQACHDQSPAPVLGSFPSGFVQLAIGKLQCAPNRILHICSGMLDNDAVGGGVRLDIRAAARPDIVADGRQLPFADNSFLGVLIDPPYSVEYAETLYGTSYPRPSHLLREAARVLQPGRRIGILHFLVPNCPPGFRIAEITGVTQGCGYRIRAFTVFVKDQAELFTK